MLKDVMVYSSLTVIFFMFLLVVVYFITKAVAVAVYEVRKKYRVKEQFNGHEKKSSNSGC